MKRLWFADLTNIRIQSHQETKRDPEIIVNKKTIVCRFDEY